MQNTSEMQPVPATWCTDFYKVGHRPMYPENTVGIYSNMTARSNKLAPIHPLTGAPVDYVVNYGLQRVLIQDLIQHWNQTFFNVDKTMAVSQYKAMTDGALGPDSIKVDHLEALHDLGYLPIEIRALPEGLKVPFGIPLFTITNTLKEYYWLTNYLESYISAELWHGITIATIASIYHDTLTHYAKLTGAPLDFVVWQGHDFSFRGMSGYQAAANASPGHLIPFFGTDTVAALWTINRCYSGEKTFIGGSVPATEHSVMCAGGEVGEIETFRRLIKLHPTGILSVVSDTWDYWNTISNLARELKPEIEARQPNALGIAKVVFRPDSGDPVEIVCGRNVISIEELENLHPTDVDETKHDVVKARDGKFYEIEWTYNDWDGYVSGYTFGKELSENEVIGSLEVLWRIFGGNVNEAGYRVLNPRVGLIYGDSITLQRCHKILERMAQQGFASCNIVFGIGSYTYQMVTRDTLGFAVKATAAYMRDHHTCTDNFKLVELYKDPKTGDGVKKSARGLLQVVREDGTLKLKQQVDYFKSMEGELKLVFRNGFIPLSYTWDQVRENYKNS